MRLQKPSEMSREQILRFSNSIYIKVDPSTPTETLKTEVEKLQHNRQLAIWHDHSTILQTLFALCVLYDPAVFFTESEYKTKTGKQVNNLQSIIEEPEIYMIAPSSSSPSEQLALIGDRLECLGDFKTPCKTSTGAEGNDTMRFFAVISLRNNLSVELK